MTELKTYGLKPRPGEWRVWEIDGWPLLAQVDENDDGEGIGIRYSTSLGGDNDAGVVSVWVGSTKFTDKLDESFTSILAKTDDNQARKALQMLLDQVGAVLGDSA